MTSEQGQEKVADFLKSSKNPLIITVGDNDKGIMVVFAVALIQTVQTLLYSHSKQVLSINSAKLASELTDEDYYNSDLICVGDSQTNKWVLKAIKEHGFDKELKIRDGFVLAFKDKFNHLRIIVSGKSDLAIKNAVDEFVRKLLNNEAIFNEMIFSTLAESHVQPLPPLYVNILNSYSKEKASELSLKSFFEKSAPAFISNLDKIPFPELLYSEYYELGVYLYNEAHTSFILGNYVASIICSAACMEHLLKRSIQNRVCHQIEDETLYNEVGLIVDRLELNALQSIVKKIGIIDLIGSKVPDFSKRLNLFGEIRNTYSHMDRTRLNKSISEKLSIEPEDFMKHNFQRLTQETSKSEAEFCLQLLKEFIIFLDGDQGAALNNEQNK
ncbi:hypothetical protein C4580_01755 [Candidatus Woesearchaeota archaeon]|nr:MAG: hypothetical protein C4580_01755 [Candidatus Woesearchaeota archaeon]